MEWFAAVGAFIGVALVWAFATGSSSVSGLIPLATEIGVAILAYKAVEEKRQNRG